MWRVAFTPRLLAASLLAVLVTILPPLACADNHCPRPPQVPAYAKRWSCPTHTQTYHPGEPRIHHPGGSPGRDGGAGVEYNDTGNGAIGDGDVYCQQTPQGQVIPRPYGGTRRNIPCGPNFQRPPQAQPQPSPRPCSGPYIRTTQDLAKLVFRNYEDKPILIAPLCNQPNVYLVALSGTQFKAGRPTGLEEIFATALRQVDNYSRDVVQSLIQTRVPPGATIILAGHSLGGMVAQNLPVLPKLGYSISMMRHYERPTVEMG